MTTESDDVLVRMVETEKAAAAAHHAQERGALRAEIAEYKATNKAMAEELEKRQKELDTYDAVLAAQPKFKPIKPEKRRGGSESVAIALASDWHVEEVVDPSTVLGRNKYNPEIAKRRSENYFRKVVELVDAHRPYTKIKRLVLWLGGDLITGQIHDEFKETNAMPPLEAIEFAGDLLRPGIEYLLDNFDEIDIPTSFGNHGRLTQRLTFSNAAGQNLEWWLYGRLARDYASEKRVRFHVTRARRNIDCVVYGHRLNFHHGEDVRFQGGLQGVQGGLVRAHRDWNQATPMPCSFSFIGHYHTFQGVQGVGATNGSLIGESAYSQKLRVAPEPPAQGLILVEKDRGMTASLPVFVE